MYPSSKTIDFHDFHFEDISYGHLMQKRIYKVLVICSNYDFYLLEEDGRIDEQIFNEYVSLNLRFPPVFIHADKAATALEILGNDSIDLIISMLSVGGTDTFELSKQIKSKYPLIPIVVLTPFSREVSLKLAKEDLSAIDHVFCWLGNAQLLLAIIKLIEDKMNVDQDVRRVGVQVILLVEDSIRFYSSYLPNIYKIVLMQSRQFMREALNEYKRMLTMRGRPKILLATNYEDAVALYDKYRDNILGVISDISYKRAGKPDKEAGLKLCRLIREADSTVPFLLQSSHQENSLRAKELDVPFLYKHAKTINLELRDYLFHNLGFGDFVFRLPPTMREVGRAGSLQDFQQKVAFIPVESLRYHFNRNDISRWLNARALFSIAAKLKHITLKDMDYNIEYGRTVISDAISNFRIHSGRGVIATFDRATYDGYQVFARIGEGSLGGKARGLAFIDSFIKRHASLFEYDNVLIAIPRTVVLCTDVFDEFMQSNDLYRIALNPELSDREILEGFLSASLPQWVMADLEVLIRVFHKPLAIRSSSVLEDSHYQPFAGIYATYMIPYADDKCVMMRLLAESVKSVYASVFYKASKAYMEATSNMIDEEKMGIIIQEVCGTQYDNVYYPSISGVARSINFYPIELEKQGDGIAKIAFGLGKTTVEGGVTLRFSPKYPKKLLQLSSPDLALRETQKEFYALDLNPDSFKHSVDDGVNILKMPVSDAEKHSSLKFVASTYDYENEMIRHGMHYKGKRLITFANVLVHNTFPLAQILQTLLEVGQNEMNNPIEIEFAVDLDEPPGMPKIFYFLQIRPIVENNDVVTFNLDNIKEEETIIYSKSALGNGIIDDVCDFVYIKPESFDSAHSNKMAEAVEKLNRRFVEDGKPYILVGPGRWGSSDPWLGIPVKWSQISAARLIVEAGLKDYRIDPSQGTHFFQNLTSFRVGYFTINPFMGDGHFDLDFLNAQEAFYENEYLRHIRFSAPLVVKIDGKNNKGVVYKPQGPENA
jgi:CheY-like chemotaxis protein